MISKNEIKYIKSLKVKKYRVREKRFVVEGAKNVLELLKSDFNVELLLTSEAFAEDNLNEIENVRAEVVSSRVLTESSSFKTNTTCLAVVHSFDRDISEVDTKDQIFVLDGVSDPGNLGTIIRTLDWFGYSQLICSLDSADFFNPKVISSTMGSFNRVKTYYTNLETFLSDYQLPIYGAVMNGVNMYDNKLSSPSLVILGSESHGISESVRKKVTHQISIPGEGEAESLNVGVATGLIAGYLRMP